MLLIAYIFISLFSMWVVSKKEIKLPLELIIISAFLLRIIITLLFLTSKSNDLETFLRDGGYLLNNDSKYEASYFPFISHLGLVALFFKNYLHPYIFLKIVFSIFDSILIIPLFYLAKKNLQTVLIYALNPISIIITNIHGQMDSIPLFFFITGLLFFIKGKILKSILTISYGIYTKSWPGLFVIPLIKKARNKFIFFGLVSFPLIFTFIHTLIFPTDPGLIFRRVGGHMGIFGAWGFGKLADYFADYKLNPLLKDLMKSLFLFSLFVYSVLRSDRNIIRNILYIMLFFFVFTPSFGIQWLIWIVPFIIIVRPKYWLTFLFFGSIFLAFSFAWDAYRYLRDIMPLWNSVINRVGFLYWLFISYMFFSNVLSQTSKSKKDRRKKSSA